MEQLFLTLLAVSVAVTIAALVVLLPRLPLASMEKKPEKRVKHLLDYKHPGIWVAFMAVAVCILSGSILLADPGEQAQSLIEHRHRIAAQPRPYIAAGGRSDHRCGHIHHKKIFPKFLHISSP